MERNTEPVSEDFSPEISEQPDIKIKLGPLKVEGEFLTLTAMGSLGLLGCYGLTLLADKIPAIINALVGVAEK